MPKFSIITVCYNAEEQIENTVKSVIDQDYEDYEYIIVDGASTDKTLDIVKRYASENTRIKCTSEKDNGLYDAMNKGLKQSTGDYIEFLNAGDLLYENDTLSCVAAKIEEDKKNSKDSEVNKIYYGNITYMNPDGSENARIYGKSCGKAIYYATGDCVNHQACFAKRSCFNKKLFDSERLSICADRDWMMRQSKSGTKWIPLNQMVVKYDLGTESVSVRDRKRLKVEERICLKNNYPLMLPIYSVFEFLRNNKVLAKILHKVYEILYIK